MGQNTSHWYIQSGHTSCNASLQRIFGQLGTLRFSSTCESHASTVSPNGGMMRSANNGCAQCVCMCTHVNCGLLNYWWHSMSCAIMKYSYTDDRLQVLFSNCSLQSHMTFSLQCVNRKVNLRVIVFHVMSYMIRKVTQPTCTLTNDLSSCRILCIESLHCHRLWLDWLDSFILFLQAVCIDRSHKSMRSDVYQHRG